MSVIDLRKNVKDFADYVITVDDLVNWEKENGRQIDSLIIFWTGWASRISSREAYFGTASLTNMSGLHFPGR